MAGFPDGSCLVTTKTPTQSPTLLVGAGEPNETELLGVPGSLLIRLRGAVTELAAETQSGSNVEVRPTNAAEAGDSDVQVTFASVTAAGETTAVVTDGDPTPPLPLGFDVAGKWYEISTTASYTGQITICIDYDENGIADESVLELMHYENGAWVPVTSSRNTETNRICGTTGSLSPFAIVIPAPVTIQAEPAVISSFGGVTRLTVTTQGAMPLITSSAGTLLGYVAGSGSVYTQDLQASPGADGAWVNASVGEHLASVFVRFVPVDPDLSTISVDPATTFQGGHATVTVTLRNGAGGLVGGLGPVTVSTSLGSLLGTVSNSSPGVFTQLLAATQTGTAQLTANVDGLALNATAALDVRDPALYGSVIGLNASSQYTAYASIQEAVNRAAADHLVQIFVSAGNYREIVKLAGLHDLVLEALSGVSPVTVQGFRIDRCQQVTLYGFDVDASGSNAPGFALAGGQNGISGVYLTGCNVAGASSNHAGIGVGPNHGALSIEQCTVSACAGNGIDLAQGGPYAIRYSTISGNGWNGVSVDKFADVLIDHCLITDNGAASDSKRGYGVLRQRAPGSGSPTTITLIENVLSGNHGALVPGRSSAELGNYDQVLDPTDDQDPPY